MPARLLELIPKRWPHRVGVVLAGALVGFIAVVALHLHPSAPESRLPGAYRLAALIQRQQQTNDQSRGQIQDLQQQIQNVRGQLSDQKAGAASADQAISDVERNAGVRSARGTGFTVTLDDSTLDKASTGNNNDLVIHSQDVQAVVNALWQSGATAISVSGQRLVSTSAVLCVGNTLLLNGTVHSPPYEVAAIGASRSQFLDDQLVKNLRSDADRFSLRFSVGREESLDIPAFAGATSSKYAQPAT